MTSLATLHQVKDWNKKQGAHKRRIVDNKTYRDEWHMAELLRDIARHDKNMSNVQNRIDRISMGVASVNEAANPVIKKVI